MSIEEVKVKENPLGTRPVGTLLRQFAIPSIIAMLVGALYNIVDQFFIGNAIGELGNAATNIAFPLSISCVSIALLLGIGGASAFNLTMGEGDKEKAPYYIGNSVSLLLILGAILTIVTEAFLPTLLNIFGSPKDVYPYALEYTRITAWGFPFMILAGGGAHVIRADGSPRFSMICNLTGAVVNTVLDALFIFKFGMGMRGAALATIIGQYVSGIMVLIYIRNYKTVTLKKEHFIPKAEYFLRNMSLGAASFMNQIAMMVVQIVLNNSLKYYGGRSIYGENIPIAVVGIISKVGMMFFSFIIGISQGLQPIVSFNYGAKKFIRVRKATFLALIISGILSIGSFTVFQVFPRNIIEIFGKGSGEEYYRFAVMYFRIYFFFTIINFLQPIISNFFSATGRPQRGMFLSLTRQIIFLIPLILILPLFFGIDGILYAGPIADAVAAIICITMGIIEFKKKEYWIEDKN